MTPEERSSAIVRKLYIRGAITSADHIPVVRNAITAEMDTENKGSESPLRANIEGCELVIRVGINRLDGHDYHPRIPYLKFDDRNEWARDIIARIEREEEDGSNHLNSMFDDAMEEALEQGSLGISEDSFTFVGECPVCGKDCVALRHTRNGVRCENCQA